jgi:aldoxime dehydratase
MPRNNMPENWQPPVPAWQADWKSLDDPMVTVYFGIQADSPAKLDAWANLALHSKHAPARIERGHYVDQADVSNHLYICYWTRAEYALWWNLNDNKGWWQSDERLYDGVGYWREVVAMPYERFETLNSSTEPHGISAVAETLEGPIDEHGYAGGMRDRIPMSDTSELKSDASTTTKIPSIKTHDGKRTTLFPPENTCIIRSGQNWSYCDDEQRPMYLKNVHPVLKKGMRFLRDNPIETECYCMRFVDTKGENWTDLPQSFGLGYASDIYAFEEWAKSHPTHLAILDRFMAMAGKFGERLQLKLWHEVVVLPKEGCDFEYINCHNQTGLLSYT